jgi:hypothetical protein
MGFVRKRENNSQSTCVFDELQAADRKWSEREARQMMLSGCYGGLNLSPGKAAFSLPAYNNRTPTTKGMAFVVPIPSLRETVSHSPIDQCRAAAARHFQSPLKGNAIAAGAWYN